MKPELEIKNTKSLLIILPDGEFDFLQLVRLSVSASIPKNKWYFEFILNANSKLHDLDENGLAKKTIDEYFYVFKFFINFFDLSLYEQSDSGLSMALKDFVTKLANEIDEDYSKKDRNISHVSRLSYLINKESENDNNNLSTFLKAKIKKDLENSEWSLEVNGNYIDMRQLLVKGLANLEPREFYGKSIKQKTNFVDDPERFEFVKSVGDILQNQIEQYKSIFYPKKTFKVVRSFVSHMDDFNGEFSKEEITKYSSEFIKDLSVRMKSNSLSAHTFNDKLSRHTLVISRYIGLPFQEYSQVLSAFNMRSYDKNAIEWVLIKNGFRYDFRYLLALNKFKKNHKSFNVLAPKVKNKYVNNSPKCNLIKKFKDAMFGRSAMGISTATIRTEIHMFASFLKYFYAKEYSFDYDSLRLGLIQYSRYRVAKARGTIGSNKHANKAIQVALEAVSLHLDANPDVFKPHLSMASRDRKVGIRQKIILSDELSDFNYLLAEIIKNISVDNIKSEDKKSSEIIIKEKSINLLEGLSTCSSDNHSGVFFMVKMARMIQWRVWAEFVRFIAHTGLNRSVVSKLLVSDITGVSEKKLEFYKSRKSGEVTIRITKVHRKQLDSHVNFLTDLLGSLPKNLPLFPHFSRNIHERNCDSNCRLLTYEFAFYEMCDGLYSFVNKTLDEVGISNLTASQLRFAKSQRFLHETNGNILSAAKSLGNDPATTYAYYGGMGDLHSAAKDFSKFFALDENDKHTNSFAPGVCVSKQKKGSTKGQEEITCGVATACLSCIYYRGENSLDFVHRLLSWQQILRLGCNGINDSERKSGILLLDTLINGYCRLNKDKKKSVQSLRLSISNGENIHPLWANHFYINQLTK